MKKLIVSLVVLFAVIISLFVITVNFSEKTDTYICSGEYDNEQGALTGQAFLKINRLIGPLSLLSRHSDGNAMIDFVLINPSTGSSDNDVDYYWKVDDTFGNIILHDSWGAVGMFYGLSNRIRTQSPYGYFKGTCTVTAN